MTSELKIAAGQPIRLGSHAPLTGPMAMFGEILTAARARLDELNAAGGVHGHRVELHVGDDRYEPARTPAVVERLIAEHELHGFFLCVGTPPHSAVVDRITGSGLLDLAVVTGASSLADRERVGMYIANVPYRENGALLGGWAREAPRAGAITYDTDFGRDWLRGFERGHGRVVSTRLLTDEAELEDAVSEMRAQGVEAVLLALSPTLEARAIRHAEGLGFTPTWLVAFVDGLIAELGALAEGIVGSHWLFMAEGVDTPALAAHRRLMAARAPTVTVTGTTVGGHAMADLLIELLRRAGPSPDRARLHAALASFDGTWRSELMRVAPRLSPGRPVIFDRAERLVVRDGEWVALAT